MPRQEGPVYITGTINGICFYQMNGKYYARRKSSLSRKRVKYDRRFARTRKLAEWLADASKIAAKVYHLVPRKEKKHAMYREMTGQAMKLLKQGVSKAEVQERMQQEVTKKWNTAEVHQPVTKVRRKTGNRNTAKTVQPGHKSSQHEDKAANSQQVTVWTVMTREGSYQVQVREPDGSKQNFRS